MEEFDIDIDELDDSSPRVEHPKNIKISLKDHQLSLLARCIHYENNHLYLKDFSKTASDYANASIRTNMAIIGDRVGSGKSYVILSLIITNDLMQKDNTTIKSYGMNNVVYYLPDKKKTVKTNVLVIPHNLISQWEEYIKNFSNNIRYKIINRQKQLDIMYEESFDIENFDLLVVTGTFYSKFSKYINERNLKLQRLIIDEVDNLNVPGGGKIEACFTWFITASYGNILYPKGFVKFENDIQRHIEYATGLRKTCNNHIKDIFMDLYNNVSSNLMKVLIIKNSEAFVEKSILLPPINNFLIKCRTPNTINILNGIVDKNIIECLNANDINGALQHINQRNKGNEDNIVRLLIDKYTKQLNNINLNVQMVNQMIFENETERRQEIDNVNLKKKIVEDKINAITERIKENNICIICYDQVHNNRTITKCCQNSFCFECINKWLMNRASCPMCKQAMNTDDYLVIDNSALLSTSLDDHILDEDKTSEFFDKYKNLKIILKNRKARSKFLIFSSFESTFLEVLPILTELKIKFEYLKGSSGQVSNIVKRYKDSDLDVLLINMRNYGSGLNLENTSDIIMFHKDSNQSENQVIGRAHRMGKKDPLNIHYLLYANEIK
jgi:SNF2 family DNA or RNA helicase